MKSSRKGTMRLKDSDRTKRVNEYYTSVNHNLNFYNCSLTMIFKERILIDKQGRGKILINF